MTENDGDQLTPQEREAWRHLSGDAERHAGHRALLLALLGYVVALGLCVWLAVR